MIYSVPETARGVREQIRKELAWLGFGPLTSSTYVSPHDRPRHVRETFADLPAVRLDTLTCQSSGLTVDREMAARCWDLATLDADYRELLRTLPRPHAGLPGRRAVAARGARGADAPDLRLPQVPLPRPGPADRAAPGRDAHEMFIEAYDLLRGPAEAHIDQVVAASS